MAAWTIEEAEGLVAECVRRAASSDHRIGGRPSASVMDWLKDGSEKFAPLAALARQPLTPAEGGNVVRRDDVILGGVGITGGGQEEDRTVSEALAALGYAA